MPKNVFHSLVHDPVTAKTPPSVEQTGFETEVCAGGPRFAPHLIAVQVPLAEAVAVSWWPLHSNGAGIVHVG